MASNTVEFTIRGNDKFSSAFGKVNRAIGSTIRTTAKFTAGAAGAATAVAFFTKKIAEGQDRAAKFATRIGVAVDELTRMQHVAEMSGIGVNQFNMATQRMTRRLSEAANGTGEAQDAIAELGLDAEKIANLPMSEQLSTIADRMGNVQGRADRLRIAFKLFDSEGASMIQMLDQGSEAMQEMAKDAEFLGIMVSKQAAANAEEFTNQTTRLTGAIKGASRSIANEWIPVMTGLAEQTANAIASMRDDLSEWATRAMRFTIGAFVVLKRIITQIMVDVDNLFSGNIWQNFLDLGKQAFMGVLRVANRVLPVMAQIFIAQMEIQWKTFVELAKLAWESVIDVGRIAWTKIKGFFTGQEGPGIGELLAKELTENVGMAMSNIADQTATARSVMADLWKELGSEIQIVGKDAANAMAEHFSITGDEVTAEIDRIIEKLRTMGQVSREESTESTERIKSFMEELNELVTKQLQTIGTVQKQLAQGFLTAMSSAIDQISAGLAQVAVQGRNFGEMMKQVGKAVLTTLLQMLIKIGLQRVVLQGIQQAAEAAVAQAQMARAAAMTYANAFASTAAIPIVGPALAPGVAATAVTTMTSGATAAGAAGSALGASIVGVGHKGMEDVPREGTFLLDRGERVLSKKQNEDLTRFLEKGDRGSGVQIGTVQVTQHIDAGTVARLLRMSDRDAQELMARKLIPASNTLSRQGVRQIDLERTGR